MARSAMTFAESWSYRLSFRPARTSSTFYDQFGPAAVVNEFAECRQLFEINVRIGFHDAE